MSLYFNLHSEMRQAKLSSAGPLWQYCGGRMHLTILVCIACPQNEIACQRACIIMMCFAGVEAVQHGLHGLPPLLLLRQCEETRSNAP